jgi:hypothetical protein
MRVQLATTLDAMFAWTANLELRNLVQFPCSLSSEIQILKSYDIHLSLTLRWLAHNWSRYIVTIGMHITLRVAKIADGSLYWLADI